MYEPQNFFYFSKYLILFVSVLVCNTLEGTILILLSSVTKFFIESEAFYRTCFPIPYQNLQKAISNLRKNFLAKGISLNFRALTFSLNMKNPPYHIESVTYEDHLTMHCTVPGFFIQAKCHISEISGGRPYFCSSTNSLLK